MATRRILKLIRQARVGSAHAQVELACCYLRGGEGLSANSGSAYKWLAQAADNGHPDAAWLIGEHIPPSAVDNIELARPYYQQAATRGSQPARLALAKWTFRGMACSPSREERQAALETLTQAARAGNIVAQVALCGCESGTTDKDAEMSGLLLAAETGNRAAMQGIFEHYWDRAGGDIWYPGHIPADHIQPRSASQRTASRIALHWHERLWANQAHAMPAADARRRGTLLLVLEHPDALTWISRGAENDDPIAAYLFGLIHMGQLLPASQEPGHAPPGLPRRNYKQAAQWLKCAARARLAEAHYALWLLNGQLNYAQREQEQRAQLLSEAAELGHPHASLLKACQALREYRLAEAGRWLSRTSSQGTPECPADCAGLLMEVAEPDQKLLRASSIVRPHDPRLALRLALGGHFRLAEHEFLLLDADCARIEGYLLIDVRAGYPKARPRLVRVTTEGQREALRHVWHGLANNRPASPDNHAGLKRKFRQQIQRLGITLA